MNLTFEKGYDDYTDSVGWRKVYEEARRFSARLTRESAGGMDDEELLSAMEQLEELIRYYGYRQDLRSLEPIMAKMNMLLSLGRDRKLNRVEVPAGGGKLQRLSGNCPDLCAAAEKRRSDG